MSILSLLSLLKTSYIETKSCNMVDKSDICSKQDKVNNADSAFIFLIGRNQWSGWLGRRRWSGLVWSDSQDDFDSECIGFDGSTDD